MDYKLLTKIPLFHSVAPQELEAIFRALNIAKSHFRKGDILALQDEVVNRLIILLKGSIKGEMVDQAGRVVKVEDVHAPSPLAILFLFGENNRFPVQAIALEDVDAVVIRREAVLRMLSINETILKNYLDISADFASRLSRKLNFMSLRTIRQKLAVYLLEQAQKQGADVVQLEIPKTSLAEYFGVSRPSLEREITNMCNEGMISAERREITILDRAALVELTQ